MRFRDRRWGVSIALGLLLAPACVGSEHLTHGEADVRSVAGTWRITYTNGAWRTYRIEENGTVTFLEEQSMGELRSWPELLLRFDDGKLERLNPTANRIFVEHFNPASEYPDGTPAEIGIGRLVSWSK